MEDQQPMNGAAGSVNEYTVTTYPEKAEEFRSADTTKRAVEERQQSSEGVFFMDEEAVFSMPSLLANMAEAMLLPPPYCVGNDGYGGDDMEADADVSLWSCSI